MADKIFHSSPVTFIDRTDDRKLDVYISSNHPTIQLHNTNADEYTPDWSVIKLELKASFYVDSTAITPTKIEWSSIIGTTITVLGSNSDLYVSTNVLKDNPIITYRCSIEYQNLKAFKDIIFTRVDTGENGKDGSSAPAVQAQYSVDGSAWTSTLNAATHKYIRHSYDGGKTWTTAIKMVGEDGTSVRIKGTATSATSVAGTDYYTLVYSGSSITGAEIGDSYLYNGDLYVCADSRDGQDYFINVGGIQGPKGSDGLSSYVFIRYATDANGTGMSTSPSGKTYMGVYTSNTNVAPTTANSYTWSKFVGDSAKSIILSGDSQVFKVSTSNVYTPATIKVTAQAINTSVTAWTYSTNGGQTFVTTAPTGIVRSGNVVTITGSTLTTNSVVIKASDGLVEDVFTVYKAFDGTNGAPGAPGEPALMAFLTNENVTFAADASGNIATTSIETRVVAYNGTTKIIPEIRKNTDGSYAISGLPTGMSFAVGTVANNEIPIVFTITNNATVGYTATRNGSINIPISLQGSTLDLTLSWSKVNSGAQGGIGPKGSDAYTVLLTNESHVFAGDVSNAVASSATTQVLAYSGSSAQTVTISSVNGKTAATIDTDTGIAGLKFKCSALNGTSPTITFTCTTSFVSASGTIPIVLSVGGVQITKMFTYSIAFKGATGGTGAQGPQGSAATSYWLVSSASAVQKTSTGTITVTPSTLTFTGKSQTGTNAPVDYACRWIIAYSTDGTNYTNLYTSTANEASKSITVATTYKTIRTRMYMAGGTTALIDEQIIPVVSDGATGPKGVGVKSTTVSYGVSDSASTRPADNAWQSTIPVVAEGKYLWTRTIIDYTDDAIADTVTYTYAKQGSTGATGPTGSSGTSVTVKSIKYQSGTSATTAPTSTWSDSVVTVAEGNYLWTQTTFSDNKVAYGVAKQGAKGEKGDAGRGVSKITEYYLATTTSSGVTTSTSGWTEAVQTIDSTKKYLWNYELITYTDGTTSATSPVIIGVYGNTGATGKGISSVAERYLATTLASGVTTSTSGWTPEIQVLTATKKYLWNYEIITYTDGTTSTISPVIIGVYGDKGDKGNQGDRGAGISSVTVTYGTSTSASTQPTSWQTTLPTVAEGSYLWTRTVTDYTDASIADTVTLTYAKQGAKGSTGSAGTSVTVSSIQYQAGTSATTAPTGTWSNSVVTVAEGSYLWTKTTFSDGKIAYGVAKQGAKGSQGVAGTPAVTFQIYAQNGYILTKETPSLTLQTFAYEGSVAITSGATYQWSQLVDGVWTAISGATSATYTVTQSDVLKAKSYRCVMTYKSNTYTSTATVQDKTDIYNSIMCISSNASGHDCYWVLYTLVYTDTEEVDPLLGPVSIEAPTSPANGDYWYAVDASKATVTLKKYNGSSWADSTDAQSLSYYWDLINNGSAQVPLGASSKVKVVSCNDFTATATLVCEVSNVEDGLLTQSSLSITDASDPIVSADEPTGAVDGQIWIKPNSNGTYLMFVWDTSLNNWISSDMDSRTKVYTSRPTSYNIGDLWITASDADHGSYLQGTLLQAQKSNTTYNAADWSPTLRYDQDIDEMKNTLNNLSQYVTITSAGLRIGARNTSGELSPFTSLFTSTELSFYQNSEKLLTLANNQLTAPRIVVEDDLAVQGSISLGDLKIIIESNGSFSFVVQK